jgi:predicted transcriptional regulator
MSTTTIRLDDDLRSRVTAAAERTGVTAHAFMLDAITQGVSRSEEDEAFHRLADARWSKFLADGKVVPWSETKAWIEAAARGESRPRPTARTFKR